jgi:hypothetical protein
MVRTGQRFFLLVGSILLFAFAPPTLLWSDSLLSPNLAKSTAWISLFAKKDQDKGKSLITALDKARNAMILDGQTSVESLSVYGDKVRLLEALIYTYNNDEAALLRAEQWLELPALSLLDAKKELARLKLLYASEGRAFADFQFGHRSGSELLTYSKQEEMLLKNGKAFADFLTPRISSLGKTSLKPLALSLASRLQLHPDCPPEIAELAAKAERLSSSLYRQWVLISARGSPAALVPAAFKGLQDSPEGRDFEKALRAFSESYNQKKKMRESVPTAIILGIYTDILANITDIKDAVPPLNLDFLNNLFSSQIVQLSKVCSTDPILRRSLLEVLSMSWVYASRPELYQNGLWPFGAISPEMVRTSLQPFVIGTDDADAEDTQASWSTVLDAETFAVKVQKAQDLATLLPMVSEFILQNQAFELFLESPRYAAERAELFQKFQKAFYGAPSISSLVPLPFNQAFLLIQWNSQDLLTPELLGLLIQSNKRVVNKELHPWLQSYLVKLGRMKGIPEGLLINQALYGSEPNCMLLLQANNSVFQLVYYTNRLGIQE